MGVYNKILEQVADGTTHIDLNTCLHCLKSGDKLDNLYLKYFYRKTTSEWYVRYGDGKPYRKSKAWEMYTNKMEHSIMDDLISLDSLKILARQFPDAEVNR